MGRLANFDPEFYVPPPRGGFTNPSTSGFVLPDNYEGPAPEGFPRSNSTLVDDPVQLHPEPRIGLAWRPSSSRDIVVRTGYGLYANRVSFFGSSVDLAFNPPFQLSRNLVGAANAASSLQHPFPVLPLPSSFPNFAAAARSAIHRGSHPSARRCDRSGFQGRDDSALRSGDSVPTPRLSVLARVCRRQRHSPCRVPEQQPTCPGESHESSKWVDHELGRQCRRASSVSRYRSARVWRREHRNIEIRLAAGHSQQAIESRLSVPGGLHLVADPLTQRRTVSGLPLLAFTARRCSASRYSTIRTTWPRSGVRPISIADTGSCSATSGSCLSRRAIIDTCSASWQKGGHSPES